jgi:SulP family sulfate permease
VLAAVRRSPLGERLGETRMFYNLEHVVMKYQEIASSDGDAGARR